ncbi:hypothetical protein P1X15_27525 [Runella sp. MFBS21]|uniref:hypothetical protein n=1 Tax=Runella sp. MFBS21 TaxID=3034018 RepID=UPI0023F64E00|nr:hypothetical protein [Runella sp. MFBS21]MDF7821405.1 hypothetical protein [Runella sp. MFBS21]
MRLIITLLLLCIFSSGMAQKCEKIQIKDQQIIDAIGELIITCNKANDIYKDMGVIHMDIYPDSGKTEKRINLWTNLTDSFKDNPPRQYAHLWGKIVLIYEHDENIRTPKNEVPSEQLEALLNDVGDRVFVEQKRKGRWVETYNADGSLKKRSFQKIISGGSSPCSIILLIDKKTGEIRKLKSV